MKAYLSLVVLIEKGKVTQMVDDAEKKLLVDVGHRICETRAAKGLNLEKLVRLSGISASALFLIETGKRDPRLTTLKRIANALRVSLATLIVDGSDEAELIASSSTGGGYDLGE